MAFILGRKKGMTQVWDDTRVVPITIVEAAPNTVSLLRTNDKDGYGAVQLQLGKVKREFSIQDEVELATGDSVDVSIFNKGDKVQVTATSKGRGFQGTTKRHGFGGAPKTHGQKKDLRTPGSIGTAGAGRVWKGRKMPGRMGGDTVTVKNLEIVDIRPEENQLFIKGAIPGAPGGLVRVITTKVSKIVHGSAGVSAQEEGQ